MRVDIIDPFALAVFHLIHFICFRLLSHTLKCVSGGSLEVNAAFLSKCRSSVLLSPPQLFHDAAKNRHIDAFYVGVVIWNRFQFQIVKGFHSLQRDLPQRSKAQEHDHEREFQ